MKYFFFFMMVGILSVSAESYAQKTRLSVNVQNGTLYDVVSQIEKQTDFMFFYKSNDIDTELNVSIHANDATIADILADVMKNTDLAYVVDNKHILIARKSNPAFQQITVAGTVTDNVGEPMPGVNVVVKGTTNGAVTDVDGKYSVTVPNREAVLVFSFIGYTSQEITVGTQRILNVQLQPGVVLQEVVVTALGNAVESRKIGYALTTISAKELTKVGTPNFVTALYGKAAGVRIIATQGGSAAAVSINVRGISSIMGNNQPLIIVNGVPIRNGNTGGSNYADFGSEGRVRSNGVVDINPDDIESLTILKGAAATALYGSEAANGAVIITSKRAQGKGVSIDVNATVSANFIAYVPPIQTEYGPGAQTYGRGDAYERQSNGFMKMNYQGQEYESLRWNTTISFGPKYDSNKQVLYWNGKMRPYQAISKDPWKEIFGNGYNQTYNIALNYGGDISRFRFAYTFIDEKPNTLTGSFNRHNFNLVGNLKITDNIKLDYTTTYIVSNFHNRPQTSLGIYGSFSNSFQSFLDVPLIKKMYKTSLGYRNVNPGEATLTPDESFAFAADQTSGLRNLFWDIYERNTYETDNRIISSVQPSWKIIDGLTLRGRLSTDLTSENQQNKSNTERPLALYDPNGGYSVTSRRYNIYYGDVLLMYDKNITEDIGLTVNAGWQGRIESEQGIHTYADGGLTVENMFALNVSRYQAKVESRNSELLKTAWLGTIGFSFRNYAFLEFTGRQEKSSTLLKGNNTYFYPSVNASFIFTDAFKDVMPVWYDFGKLRSSYGMVGNAPDIYWANQSYEVSSSGGFMWNSVPGSLGNDYIRPEKTTEWEIGVDNKFFQNRLGIEISYYKRTISDMFLRSPLPNSAGAQNILLNVGEMTNKGLELALYGTPIQTKDFSWELRTNLSNTSNEITKLIQGVDYFESTRGGGDGFQVRSEVGRPMGDIFVYRPRTNDKGEKLVDASNTNDRGLYLISNERSRVANAMPKIIGGVGTTVTYKSFFFDVFSDFRIGGYIINEQYQYMTGRGVTKETLNARDADHGGLTYTTLSGYTRDNGILLPGVIEESGSYRQNDIIAPADYYYVLGYNWGTNAVGLTYEGSVQENSYWKMREMVFGYRLPSAFTSKFGCNNLTVSVFGRNLFYIYKTIKDFDCESGYGTSWLNQVVVGSSASPTRTFGFSLRASF